MKARRLVKGFGLAAAAFASDAVVDPQPAGAHCGGHAGSCNSEFVDVYVYGDCCGGSLWCDFYSRYHAGCSGTCYNGGTQGCCQSAAACADQPCKPGGCTDACDWWFDFYTQNYDPSCS